MLKVDNLSVSYGGLKLVDNVSFTVEENQWLMISGPNGAGKSTLINAISQGTSYSGEVSFNGKNLAEMKPREIARCIGVLAQNNNVGYSFAVEDIVRLGRYARSSGIFASGSQEDSEMVETALDLTGMKPMRGQSVLTLSGGELQRTFLAQLLAQDPSIIILDEPTNHLDLIYQRQTLGLIREWLKKPGRAAVSVMHDLSVAKAYGTRGMIMHNGRLVSHGEIFDVFHGKTLDSVYGLDVAEWMKSIYSQW